MTFLQVPVGLRKIRVEAKSSFKKMGRVWHSVNVFLKRTHARRHARTHRRTVTGMKGMGGVEEVVYCL